MQIDVVVVSVVLTVIDFTVVVVVEKKRDENQRSFLRVYIGGCQS